MDTHDIYEEYLKKNIENHIKQDEEILDRGIAHGTVKSYSSWRRKLSASPLVV